MSSWTLYHNDALTVLSSLTPNSIDALISDPPAGIGFMGKEWDSFGGKAQKKPDYVTGLAARYPQNGKSGVGIDEREVFIEEMTRIFSECYRVLRPGAHALVWALPRTSHWTATAIENAGFEIRDNIYHLQGQGFPKNLNVAKAVESTILKGKSNTRSLRAIEQEGEGTPYLLNGTNNGILGEIKAWERKTWEPTTEEGKAALGLGTALKPAAEIWILARKPLKGNVAQTVLEHGTGALNIDDSRIRREEGDRTEYGVTGNQISRTGESGIYGYYGATAYKPNSEGRWPANVILDTSAAEVIDRKNGITRSGKPRNDRGRGGIWQPSTGIPAGPQHGDSGGPSRYFKVIEENIENDERFIFAAKPSQKERNAGCENLSEGANRINAPRTSEGKKFRPKKNFHPTVKGLKLMRYLCSLITPKGGIILDCFAGSCSTGCAALLEGYDFLGIERDEAYIEIGRARLEYYTKVVNFAEEKST